ncbi:MAG: hypothetical protein HY903_21765 [Deltaproteobacteria bacterium]|nr:hypothetical protein [Deltaproteobacteria bacterium]
MALSLHSEYLLGFLAGAKSLQVPDVVPFALAGAQDSPQTKALLKALALGMADGRRGRALREAHEVRMHVLALMTRDGKAAGRRSGLHASEPPETDLSNREAQELGFQLESFIQDASQIG